MNVNSGFGRKLLLVVVMIAGFSLLVWAGVHNARERRLAQQQQEATKAVLIPKSTGRSGAVASDAGNPDQPMTPKLQGKPAPGFTLTTLDGKKVSLADYKGHPVLVNFWATWCEPCKLEMPWLEEFSKKYAAQGFVILGISTDEGGKTLVANTVKKLGTTYPILLANDKIQDQYDIEVAPESFYVDKGGKVLIATEGLPSEGGKDEIEANIKKLIAAEGQ